MPMTVRAAALLIVVSVGVACGGGSSESVPYEDPYPLPDEPLVVSDIEIGSHGGRFVIGQTSSPRTFNSLMSNENSSTDVTSLLYAGLANFDNQTQEVEPLLARTWEVSEDGRTWTFHLRRGARFSDGHPITSADVLFTFEVAYDETLHPSVQDLLVMDGRRWEISAPDDHTVVITTPEPVFRRAVSMAVDRDAMISSIYFGDAVKNWSTAMPGNALWYSPDIVKYDYDPGEASRLLASLGWRDTNGDGFLEDGNGQTIGFTLKTNSDNRMRVGMANFIRDDLGKVGIRVTLAPADFNTLITNLREDFDYDAILLGLQSGVPPDPALGQNVWRSSGRTHNWNAEQPEPETPEEARIDELMDVIVGTPDHAARYAAWVEIQNIVNEQAWLIWLPTQVAKLPLSDRFGNTKPSVIRHRLLWNAEEIYVRSLAAETDREVR